MPRQKPQKSKRIPREPTAQHPIALEALKRIDNFSLPPTWVDSVSTSLRRDGLATLRCYAFVPSIEPGEKQLQLAAEVARLQTSRDLLKNMVDLWARILDYYPSRPNSPQPSA